MSNVRNKRVARRKTNITKSNAVLYDELNSGSNPTLIIEETDATVSAPSVIVSVNSQVEKYDYQYMSNLYTESNPSQQLGNYRSAMDYLAYYNNINVSKNNKLVSRIKDLIYDFPNLDMTSYLTETNGAVHSWVISQLTNAFSKKYLGTNYILDGGIGLIGACLMDSPLTFENIRSFDLHPEGQFAADSMMKDELLQNWKFKSTTQDIFNLDYIENTFVTTLPDGSISEPFNEIPNIIINTNISNIEDYESWWGMIPTNRYVVLVGSGGDNVHRPFSSSIAFNRKFQLTSELYSGVQKINGINHYMKIGIK
jgi:hypothetical protein